MGQDMASAAQAPQQKGFLGWVERTGNRLPDPPQSDNTKFPAAYSARKRHRPLGRPFSAAHPVVAQNKLSQGGMHQHDCRIGDIVSQDIRRRRNANAAVTKCLKIIKRLKMIISFAFRPPLQEQFPNLGNLGKSWSMWAN